jgi:hypothetical protein
MYSWFTLFQLDVEGLDFLPGPRRPAQKFQTGFDAGILLKAMDVNPSGQILPAIVRLQLDQQCFERNALQGVSVLRVRVTFRGGHDSGVIVNRIVLYVLYPPGHEAFEIPLDIFYTRRAACEAGICAALPDNSFTQGTA